MACRAQKSLHPVRSCLANLLVNFGIVVDGGGEVSVQAFAHAIETVGFMVSATDVDVFLAG